MASRLPLPAWSDTTHYPTQANPVANASAHPSLHLPDDAGGEAVGSPSAPLAADLAGSAAGVTTSWGDVLRGEE